MKKEEFLAGFDDFYGNQQDGYQKWADYVCSNENKDLFNIVTSLSSIGKENVRAKVEEYYALQDSPLLKALK